MSLQKLAERSAEMFTRCFGRAPQWLAAAPGRVNLIGEHTDYNDGFVLPMATNQYTLMAAARRAQPEVTLHSVTTGETASFSLRGELQKGEPAWSNYVRGVISGFQKLGTKVPGLAGVIESEVPYGGGLASSAALEVAAATLLEAAVGRQLEPVEKARLCQRAEHDFAGVPCGIMDQFTSVLAQENHALLLDCRDCTTTPVRMTDPAVSVLIINTNVRHKLAEGEYGRRRAQCEAAAKTLKVSSLRDATLKELEAARKRLDPVVFRRARHVITENHRTLQAARAFQASQWETAGKLMYESHKSLAEDYDVSCPELDAVVSIAQSIGLAKGMFGCRMTGAGFGGCAVGLILTEAVTPITRLIDEGYEHRTGLHATIFCTRPSGGARLLEG